jgi:hypothetical protein
MSARGFSKLLNGEESQSFLAQSGDATFDQEKQLA